MKPAYLNLAIKCHLLSLRPGTHEQYILYMIIQNPLFLKDILKIKDFVPFQIIMHTSNFNFVTLNTKVCMGRKGCQVV